MGEVRFLFSFCFITLFSVVQHGIAQSMENTDVCLNSKNNEFFSKQWCETLSMTESCRLGIMNLLFAAAEGDTESLMKYHSSGMDMSLADYDKRAAIHLSAAEGHLQATKFLLEVAKVSPSPMDRWGNTPLDEAKRFNQKDVVEYLMSFIAKS